ncbi:MAG: TIM barrel protein [Phycisphaerae bacterium]|jgi:hydroxypyruvate isomerase
MSTSETLTRRSVLSAAAGVAGSLALTPAAPAEDASERKPNRRINQSICRWCYNGKLELEELCKQAVRLGYQSIELIDSKVWPTVKKYGLTAAMVPGSGSIANGWNRKENHGPQIEEMKKNLDLAADAGLPNVICFSGNRRGQPDEEGIRNCIEGLKQVVGHAEKRKVNICMEILNSKVDHKDYAFDRMGYGVAIARAVGSERFGILYDIYHAQIMEGDVIRTIRDYHQYIRHYHTGGNPGRNEIDETQELYYPAIMRAIVATGFKGYVAQEFIPKGDPVKGLADAFRICDV